MNMISKILIFVLSVSFFFSVASSSETKIMARELSWYETNYPNTTIDKIFENSPQKPKNSNFLLSTVHEVNKIMTKKEKND